MKNPVAKNMHKFNKPARFNNRKAAGKRGHTKHKGGPVICRFCGEGLEGSTQPGQPADVCDWCFRGR